MNSILLIPSVGLPEILVLLVIVLLLFGAKKIPELMRGLGSGVKEFKNAAKDIEELDKDIEKSTDSKKS